MPARSAAAKRGLIVRDPVVATLALPRFLAPGDKSQLAVSLQNVSGPAGDYKVTLTSDGAASLGPVAPETQHLDAGGSANFKVTLSAQDIGEVNIHLVLSGPDGFKLAHDAKLTVRAAQFPLLDRVVRRLKPGESLQLSEAALARFLPATGEMYASFSSLPNLDVPALLRQLDRYPYGCIEQTTSRALPLLYVSDVTKLWGAKSEQGDAGIKDRIQKAIGHVLEMQRYDGGFALWDASGEVEPWLSAYAMDFLTRAKAKGFDVSDIAYANGLRWLTDYAQRQEENDSSALTARAYALYVLAEVGGEDISALRYIADNQIDKLSSALAQAQIGTALALAWRPGPRDGRLQGGACQPEARDAASPTGTTTMAERCATGRPSSRWRPKRRLRAWTRCRSWSASPRLQASSDWLSTQEQSWLILAANAMSARASKLCARRGRCWHKLGRQQLLSASRCGGACQGPYGQERRRRADLSPAPR